MGRFFCHPRVWFGASLMPTEYSEVFPTLEPHRQNRVTASGCSACRFILKPDLNHVVRWDGERLGL